MELVKIERNQIAGQTVQTANARVSMHPFEVEDPHCHVEL